MKNLLSLLLVTILTVYFCYRKVENTSSIERGNYGVIDWDNFGYYLYLPAIFIYDDVKLIDNVWVKEAQRKYSLSSNYYQAHRIENGNHIIQYSAGMAFLYSPAFVVGHQAAKITSYPADGFSKPYQIAVLLQSFLMVFLGLFFLRKLALCYFNDQLSTILIFLLCVGTNFLQIVPANISSPHVYLFGFYAALLYLVHLWHNTPQLKYSILIGLLSALMILSRPNELLFLMVPVLWLGGQFKTYQQKVLFFWNNKKHIIAVAVPLVLFGLVQPIYWHYTTGEWIFDSYTNEDFKLLSPYLKEYLFSYKKGWLLYTPIMAIGLIGLFITVKKKRGVGLPILLFMLLNIWVLSSWDCWWYADSFSQRSIVQSYPIFLLPFGHFIQELNLSLKRIKVPVITLLAVIVVLNIFQVWQFEHGIIHPQRMTKEYYWNAFGKTAFEETNRSLLEPDRSVNYLPEKKPKKHKLIFIETFSNQDSTEVNVGSFPIKEEGSLLLTKDNRWSKLFKYAFKDLSDTSYSYMVSRIRFKSDFDAKANPFGIEFNMIDAVSGKSYHRLYRGAEQIDWFEKGVWSSMDMVFIPPFMRNKNDSIQINAVLIGDKEVRIDNISLEGFDPSTFPTISKTTYYNDYHTLKIGNWSNSSPLTEGKGYEKIDFTNQYSATLLLPLSELGNKKVVDFQVNINLKHNYQGGGVVVSISDDTSNYYYESYPLVRKGEGWEQQEFFFNLPQELPPEGATLKAYLWNKSKGPIFIRDVKVTFTNE
ncbi:MAG: hypothetical protein ACJASF_001454 [Vicingaceae bacterium]|jgi:hypothetical protein